jgi:multidrug efflux pump subunit AcrA (membrane-fusion protein)
LISLLSPLLPLILLLVLLFGCKTGLRPAQEEPTPTPIPTAVVPETPTYVVQRGEVVRRLEFTARVAPVHEAELFFRTNGYVRAVFVEKGDVVRKGDLLAELEVDTLERNLAQAQARLEMARLKLEQAQRANEQAIAEARINLEQARLRLARARTQDPAPRVTIARVDRDEKARLLQNAQTAYDAIAGNPGAGGSPQAVALHQATMAYQIAEAEYQQALQAQQAHEYDLRLLEKQVELAQLHLDETEAGVDPLLTKEVELAQLEVDDITAQIAEARIVAPFAGEVVSIFAYSGRAAEAFKPVAIEADLSQMEVRAELSSEQMRELVEGQAVTLVPVDYPGQELRGIIRRLPYPYGGGGGAEALAGADKSTRISVDLTGLPSEMKLEMGNLVKATVILERRADVLWLPPAAIRTFGGRKFVIVQEDGRQRRVDVTPGIESQERVEIESGLEEGQVVVGQ